MDCNEARPLLDANADHELPAPDARRVQQHIERCEACRSESESLAALRGALRAAPYHRAPQTLRARILAGLPALEVGAADVSETVLATGVSGDVAHRAAPMPGAPADIALERRQANADAVRGVEGESVGYVHGSSGATDKSGAKALHGQNPGATGSPEALAEPSRVADKESRAVPELTQTGVAGATRRPGWFSGWLSDLRSAGARGKKGGTGGGRIGMGGFGGGRNGGLSGGRTPSGGFGGPAGLGAPARLIAPGWLATLALALCAAAAVVTLNLHRTADNSPFTDELVESHVRAQVSGRDIDVISTDKHTVKPWFNGRLDYSPPVEDLAASGFPLVGGRLDYLAHQRVAVLVYHYRKHVIDVYVFPQDAAGTARNTTGDAAGPLSGTMRASFEREGYSIAQWNVAGMTWWAITDAAPDSLTGLEAALKARLAAGAGRTEGS